MKITHAFLSLFIFGAGAASAAEKPVHAPANLPESPKEAGRRAALETAAAIEALGDKPTNRQVANIVFAAVRKSPEHVLAIVHAATRVAPQSAAPSIVTAATAAVPDPWKQVSYHRIVARQGKKVAYDFKGGADGANGMDLNGQTGHGAHVRGGTVTLAEAITQTVFDAQPGLSLPELQSAVEVALNTDPATLLRYVQSSRSISGVGDAGSSNYANEPLRSRTLGGTPGVNTPNPPVVSR